MIATDLPTLNAKTIAPKAAKVTMTVVLARALLSSMSSCVASAEVGDVDGPTFIRCMVLRRPGDEATWFWNVNETISLKMNSYKVTLIHRPPCFNSSSNLLTVQLVDRRPDTLQSHSFIHSNTGHTHKDTNTILLP